MKYLCTCVVLCLFPALVAAEDCANSKLSYRAEKSENLRISSRCGPGGQLVPGDRITLQAMGSLWLVALAAEPPRYEVICQNYSAGEFDFTLSAAKPWLAADKTQGSGCGPWRDGMLSCGAKGVEQTLFCALTRVRSSEQLEQPRLTTALTVRGSNADNVITNSTIQDNQHAAMIIHNQQAAIDFCARKEQYTGNITMSWLIAPGGKTARIQILSSDGSNPGAEACLTRWISGWSFPEISQLNQRVQYTFTLSE